MIQKLLFIFCLIAFVASVATAQRTVTNADLERFRQARLKADQDYRENYKRLGMPSPEELETRREESRAETLKLYDKLRAERLELEKARAVQAAANAQLAAAYVPPPQFGIPYYNEPAVFLSGGYFTGGRYSRFYRGPRFVRQQQGYFAGGQFWPTGARTVARPILRVRHGRAPSPIRRR